MPNCSDYISCYYDSSHYKDKKNRLAIDIIQEYIDGPSIENIIKIMKSEKKKYHIDSIWEIVLELAKGLQYIHSKGVVHRDIKSRWVLASL